MIRASQPNTDCILPGVLRSRRTKPSYGGGDGAESDEGDDLTYPLYVVTYYRHQRLLRESQSFRSLGTRKEKKKTRGSNDH